jgi:pyruvate, water dikinase
VPALVSLDDEAALDSAIVGVKAANLARARRRGLRVLPGVVVPIQAARPAIELGRETLRSEGSGKARLAVDRAVIADELANILPVAGASLGENLMLRSSTTLDDDDRFSGAFASIADVRPEEVTGAVRGCWSSLFSASTIARFEAADVSMEGVGVAVLMQRMLHPDIGGWAEIQEDGSLSVAAVSGHPGPLFGGAVRGVRGVVRVGDVVPDQLRAIGLANDLATVLTASGQGAQLAGCRRIEWAVEGGQLWVLQLDPGQAADASNDSSDELANAIPGTPIHCGIPASPGRATGRVLRLHSFDEHVDDVDGRVLVVDEATAAYAPLLYRAAGLIALEGSAAAHLCTVARSLHVPAVVGLTSFSDELLLFVLNEDARVVVDGSAGTVAMADV